MCEENNIKFIALPPNSTHLMQPLDVAYFRPMKAQWRKILTTWKESGKGRKAPSFPKDQFPALLKCLTKKIEEPGCESMKAGFRKTGLYPLDRKQVLNRLPKRTFTNKDVTVEIGFLVSDSFIQHLVEARGDDHIPPNKKRHKVSVVPGKSVSSIDVVNMQAAINTNKTRKKMTIVKKTKVSTLEQQIITDNLLNNSSTDSLMIDA